MKLKAVSKTVVDTDVIRKAISNFYSRCDIMYHDAICIVIAAERHNVDDMREKISRFKKRYEPIITELRNILVPLYTISDHNTAIGHNTAIELSKAAEMSFETVDVFRNWLKAQQPSAFLTGSRAWNLETPDSDWDFCLYQSTAQLLESGLGLTDIGPDYGFKFETRDKSVINIVSLCTSEFDAWQAATQGIAALCCVDASFMRILKSKNKRVEMFRKLVDLHNAC